MGMFDTVVCKYPLPEIVQAPDYQTKDFSCNMMRYTILEDGTLIQHQVKWVAVPEEKRPHYGTEKWKDPLYQMVGSIEPEGEFDVRVPANGIVEIYTSAKNKEWITVYIRFVNGKVNDVKWKRERYSAIFDNGAPATIIAKSDNFDDHWDIQNEPFYIGERIY